MRRRDFITLLGTAAAAWPLAARAQQPRKLPLVGVLGSASESSQHDLVADFTRRLRDLGWIEGRTVAFEFRWAESHQSSAAPGESRQKADGGLEMNRGTIIAAATASVIVMPASASESQPREKFHELSSEQANYSGNPLPWWWNKPSPAASKPPAKRHTVKR